MARVLLNRLVHAHLNQGTQRKVAGLGRLTAWYLRVDLTQRCSAYPTGTGTPPPPPSPSQRIRTQSITLREENVGTNNYRL